MDPLYAVCGFLFYLWIRAQVKCISIRREYLKLLGISGAFLSGSSPVKKGYMLEDLDLATTDQLLGELRKRPTKYVMLRPQMLANNSCNLDMESHEIAPGIGSALLRIGADLMAKKAKASGEDIPDFLDNGISDQSF